MLFRSTMIKNSIKGSALNELGQFETLEGQAKLLFTNNTRQFCDKVEGSSKGLGECFKEVKESNQAIIEIFENLSQAMTKVGNLYKKISSVYNSFGENGSAQLYMNMGIAHLALGDHTRVLRNEYSNRFGDFFNFFGNEMTAVEELAEKRKSVSTQMESLEKKLLKKKEQKFELSSAARSRSSLPRSMAPAMITPSTPCAASVSNR